MKAYTVATGHVDPTKRASRKAVKYVSKLKGLFGVHPCEHGTLWLFESENSAKVARNMMNSKGILTGKNICEVDIDDPRGKKDG